MSGLIARVPQPRGVIVPIHGGGSRAAYFDNSAHPDLSLLELGRSLGFTVLAPDRPGYGASAGHVEGRSLDSRIELLGQAVTAMLAIDDSAAAGAGFVIVGHSIGCQMSTHLAVTGLADVIGLATYGSATTYRRSPLDPPRPGETVKERTREMWTQIWGPDDWYPDGAKAANREAVRGGNSTDDIEDARRWVAEIPSLTAQVRVPVQVGMGQLERLWRNSTEDLADLAGRFTAAPWVQTARPAAAPHNVSISWAARAYHLGLIAFAEQCILAKTQTVHE
jgi:pimeloyl-ACP methyl ester carboxylesterase